MSHLLRGRLRGAARAGGRRDPRRPASSRTPDRLVAAGRAAQARRPLPAARAGFPAARVSLRSASPDSFTIVEAEAGELLGFVEAERAFSTVHPGAVYLHLGEPYEVEELDIDGRRALVRPAEGDYYTQPKIETETFIEEMREDARRARGRAALRRRVGDAGGRRVPAQAPRRPRGDRPPYARPAGAELRHPGALVRAGRRASSASLPLQALLGALHAAEHSQIAVLPLIAMCDRWDIGGLSTNYHHQTGRPTIFIYDGHPGGVGITRRGFDEFERLVGDASRLIARVPVRGGLPVVRAIPEVREPQRPALQGRSARADAERCFAPRLTERRRYAAVIGPARRDEHDSAALAVRGRPRTCAGRLHGRHRRRGRRDGGRLARRARGGRDGRRGLPGTRSLACRPCPAR